MALSDLIVCRILKPLISRPRPPFDNIAVRLLVPAVDSPSMPSAHASNSFAFYMFTHRTYGRWALIMLPLTCLIAYSRVYIGVHYPSDIIAGALLGSLLGLGMSLGFKYAFRKRL